MPNPPDHWKVKVNIDGQSSDQVLALLNQQAALGNVAAVIVDCTDGKFAFFGNYKNK